MFLQNCTPEWPASTAPSSDTVVQTSNPLAHSSVSAYCHRNMDKCTYKDSLQQITSESAVRVIGREKVPEPSLFRSSIAQRLGLSPHFVRERKKERREHGEV